MIVHCKHPNVPVTIKVTVNTESGIWSYDYKDRGTHYKGGSTSANTTHALGFPHELGNERDVWAFAITNIKDQPIQFLVRIQWMQNAEEIAKWERQDSAPAKDAAFPTGMAIILDVPVAVVQPANPHA